MTDESGEDSGTGLMDDFYSAIKEDYISSEGEEAGSPEEEGVVENGISGHTDDSVSPDNSLIPPEQNRAQTEDSTKMLERDTVAQDSHDADESIEIDAQMTKINETCPICSEKFEIQSDWNKHLWMKHKGAAAVYRNSVFDIPAILLQSLGTNSLFDRPVIDILKLEQIKMDKQPAKFFRCFSCAQEFVSLAVLHAHERSIHKDALPRCQFLSRFSPDWSSCGGVMMCCSVCMGCFATHEIAGHLGLHQASSEGILCELCNAKFTSGLKMREHYASTHQDFYGKDIAMSLQVIRRIRPSINWSSVTDTINIAENVLPPIEDWPQKMEPTSIPANESSRILKCNLCDKQFGNNYHAKMVHDRTKVCLNFRCKCELCGRKFSSNWKVRRHKSQVHQLPEPLQRKSQPGIYCDHCGKAFQHASQKQQHIQYRACDPSRFTCPKCNTRFSSRASVIRHMRRTHGVRTTALQLIAGHEKSSTKTSDNGGSSVTKNKNGCTNEGTKDGDSLNGDISFIGQNLNGKSIEVVRVGTPKSGEEGYLSDVSSNSGTVPVSQPDITVSTVKPEYPNGSQNHSTAASVNNSVAIEGSNQCMRCGREFSRASDLTKHVQYNSCDPKLRECEICGRVLSSKTKLKRHIAALH